MSEFLQASSPWRAPPRRPRPAADQRGGERRRRETDGSFDEIQLSLNVCETPELQIEYALLLPNLLHQCVDQVALLTDFRLEQFESQDKRRLCHRVSPPVASVARETLCG